MLELLLRYATSTEYDLNLIFGKHEARGFKFSVTQFIATKFVNFIILIVRIEKLRSNF